MAMPRVRMAMPRSAISKANEYGTAVPPVVGGSDVAVGIGMGVGSGAPRLPAAVCAGMFLSAPHTLGFWFGVVIILLVSAVRVLFSELILRMYMSAMLLLSAGGNGMHSCAGRSNR